MSLEPGSRLGSYTVIAKIGEGGMGQVYRARDERLGRDVAIKTLPRALEADPARLARFEREARALASFSHPHIATLYGIEESGDVRALVMELVEGQTLSAVPMSAALPIARQLVDALDSAHEKGIVHRDLKPANVMVTPDGVVKVLDFGLAKAVAGDGTAFDSQTTVESGPTRDGTIVGTVAYMSPEQMRGQAIDKRTDIWAFGCVFYEMLAGRPAFARATSSDTMAAVLNSEPDWQALPADVPAPVRRLITRCLEKQPRRRLRDIGDARHVLDDVSSDAVESAAGAGGGASTIARQRGLSRRRLLFGGGAAVGLVGAGFGAGVVATGGAAAAQTPSYRRLTFRRGMIRTARFAPDYRTVFYGALWDGDVARTYMVRPDSPESSALNLPPGIPLAVSAAGELALALGSHLRGTMTFGTLARVPMVGGAPRALLEDVKYADWSPDGRDLAVVRRVGDRERLEFPTGKVVAEPSTRNGGFSFPRVSPKGDRVACFELSQATDLQGRLVIVDRSGAKGAVSSNYFNVFGLAWRGDEVWFTAAETLPLFRNAIYALAPDGRVRVVARIPGNVSLHDIAPDGQLLIARTDDRSGIAVKAPGQASERDLSWLDAPWLADISRDGTSILFTEIGVAGGAAGSTYLRGTDGAVAVRLGDGQASALSPDGRWAIVRAPGASHLDLLPTGPGEPRRLARPGLALTEARFLPGGQRVVARGRQSERPPQLYLLDLNGDATHPVTPEGATVGASWVVSPDGAEVIVQSLTSLDRYPVGGGPARRVPDVANVGLLHTWIDRGVLISTLEAPNQVLAVDPGNGRRELWKEIMLRDPTAVMVMHRLAVTPDGRAYGYRFHRALSDLYLVDGLI